MFIAVTDPAFVSIPMAPASRERLKAEAAARGETVQEVVEAVVERFLAGEGRSAPELDAVLDALHAGAPVLRARGVQGLWVVGSVARGEARPDSHVDLLCEFAPGARVSLVGWASLRAELTALLGAPADLADRAGPRPNAARHAAERHEVRAI